MSRAGGMRELVRLERNETTEDEYGGTINEWVTKVTAPARMVAMRGSEEVVSARLTGVQPWTITLRNVGPVIDAKTNWRLVDDRAETIFNIRSIVRDERGRFAEFLCEVSE